MVTIFFGTINLNDILIYNIINDILIYNIIEQNFINQINKEMLRTLNFLEKNCKHTLACYSYYSTFF
jgi:hypothetical protein